MPQGVNGNLLDITYYTNTTPVYYTSSNIPLQNLNSNILTLDQQLNGWVATGISAQSRPGDGVFNTGIVFPFTMNTVPRIVLGRSEESTLAVGKLYVAASSRTTAGFNLVVIANGTGGAWTANINWLADGR